jgi:hypothetical protein
MLVMDRFGSWVSWKTCIGERSGLWTLVAMAVDMVSRHAGGVRV